MPINPLLRFRALLRGNAFFVALACVAATGTVQAQTAPSGISPSVYVQGGWARHQTDTATVGVTLPWDWQGAFWGNEVRGYWDIYASRWSFNGVDGPGNITLIGFTPTFRMRPDNGRANWFWEGGVGITYADSKYHIPDKEFSTRYNFGSHLGVGYSLGAQREHEIMVRVQHLSNAGIKKPNPGENFVQLRYAYHF
ncbi:acyloxyacyl hydrolase [Paracidovorax valerianellae]|uniref:Lipid A deacylase n=1 Tax=Paracidovorax valerianellae TaxID=187868 RepID=A0A1G6RB55_9BURK|nr:acyloxyacyl hydrolase [Paracidovorax valerianellae]MDA8445054.1 acyloxyacyl hydrolase [Paracidovorax valerianellae]SDD01839.1 Lipid A 3-O-deacylase (PagL) [Paracidovorax valerianellae]